MLEHEGAIQISLLDSAYDTVPLTEARVELHLSDKRLHEYLRAKHEHDDDRKNYLFTDDRILTDCRVKSADGHPTNAEI